MAKNMAILNGNEVVNVSVFSDLEVETPTKINCGDLPVGVGDTYADGRFYHDGKMIKSDSEIFDEMAAKIAAVEETGITIEPKPTDLPTRPGYAWKPIQTVAGGSITWVMGDYDPTLPGTRENPIPFEDGMEVLQNYNYIRDGVMKVWFGRQHATPSWDDDDFVEM